MAHETWHRCQVRGRQIWSTEKGRGQASACYPAGGGYCLLSGLPFLHKAHPQQAPLCQSLCWSPEFHTTSTYACRVGSQTYKQLDATHGGPCQESGNIVVMSTIPPLLFRWAGSYFSFPRSQSASCSVSRCSITHLPSSTLSPPSLFAGVFWALPIAFWEMFGLLKDPADLSCLSTHLAACSHCSI